MTTPTWSSAVSGAPTRVGQINQFLGAHPSLFTYTGVAVPGAVDPSSITAASTADRISTNQFLAQQFTVTGASNISLSSVAPALVAKGAGCDLLLTVQPAGTTPTGFSLSTALAYCIIPAEWLATTTPAGLSTIPYLPLNVQPSLTPSANPYWIVITPYSNCAAATNDAMWARSGGAFTGQPYAYNASAGSPTWSTTGSAAFATFFRYSASGSLAATSEDNDAMKKSYLYSSGRISNAYEWVIGQSNPNLLSRDDATFETSVGSWSASNATIARVNGSTTPPLSGLYSMQVTSTSTPNAGVFCGSASTNKSYAAVALSQSAVDDADDHADDSICRRELEHAPDNSSLSLS